MSEIRLSGVNRSRDRCQETQCSNAPSSFVSEMYKTFNELIRHMNTIHQTHGMIHLRQNIKEKSSCFGTKGSDFSWRHQDLVMYNKTSLFLLFGKTMSSTHPMVNNQNIQQRLSTINNTWSFRHSAHSSSYQNFKVLNLISSQISSGVDWTAKKMGGYL